MFKLVVTKGEHKTINDRLKVRNTPKYDYVITDDKECIENDKLNIVFHHGDLDRVSSLLDMIVSKESVYINGRNEFGLKRVESKDILYFEVNGDDLISILSKTKLLVKMKLYEVENLLQDKEFIRVSKFCLVNIRHIDYIKVALNSKLDLEMSNGDHCEVNRSYLKDFKKALKSE